MSAPGPDSGTKSVQPASGVGVLPMRTSRLSAVFVGVEAVQAAKAIGVVLPDVHGEFFSEIVRGMDREASRRGYLLLLSKLHSGGEQAAQAAKSSDDLDVYINRGLRIQDTGEHGNSLFGECHGYVAA